MRAAILLAAGRSRRFGRPNKLLQPLAGRPLILHALDAARAVAGRTIVVLGADVARVGRALPRGIVVVRARDHDQGLSASLRRGAAALRPVEREVVVFLADMPFARLPRRARMSPGVMLARPVYRGRPGHPVLARSPALKASGGEGDRGLLGLATQALPGRATNLLDIDDRAALHGSRRLARRWTGYA